MSKPYHYVRFRWWQGADLKKVSEELSDEFSVETIEMPKSKYDIALLKDERYELKVNADTLTALLSRFRAVLSQRESAPFTEKDMKLRERILELYPRSRSTPFPWVFSVEPKFEVVE